jgi:hypothetical protein
MTVARIREAVDAFAEAARLFLDAGFDGVELAAGHGYLIHQFLSPLSNRRRDAYGGSPEKRGRFLADILDAIRVSCGATFVLGIRLSADELLPGGFTIDDSRELVRRLVARGSVDLLSVSAGTHASVEQMVGDWSVPRGNLVALARAVREVADGVPVVACGRIVDPDQAEDVLSRGDADLIGMARALIADPHWSAKAATGRTASIRPCIACNECEHRLFSNRAIACAVNPALTEDADAIEPARRSRRVLVIGGGPAGLEAARVAALRGHRVQLREQATVLGGQLHLIEQLQARAEFSRILVFLKRELRRVGVELQLGSTTRTDDVIAANPDAVIVATGSVSDKPPRAKAGDARILVPEQLAAGTEALGSRVAIVDGGTTHDRVLAVAEAVLQQGRQVYLVTPRDELGSEVSFISLSGILGRLRDAGASILEATELASVRGGEVELHNVLDGSASRLHGITALVMVTPQCSQGALWDELEGKVSHLLAVGDCVVPRDLTRAFDEGRAAGLAV